MRSTNSLRVSTDFSQSADKILIHPNDGYDLRLMQNNYSIRIFSNLTVEEFNSGKGRPLTGQILLENKCESGTIRLNHNYWLEMGKPFEVKLLFDKDKILVCKA